MDFSDPFDTLCTFSEMNKHFGSHVLIFVFDSLWQTEHVQTVWQPN